MARKSKPRQFDLFGDPIEEPKPSNEIIPLDFETHAVRMVVIKGESWWVATDVCRALGIDNSRQALARLEEDEKGVITNDTLGGQQEMAIISEPGLYALILTSRRPEAKRFKRWVTHEVLPTIRRTGTYSIDPRVSRIERRNRCNRQTAKIRVKQIDHNKYIDKRVTDEGGSPRDKMAIHNGVHVGCTGRTAKQLREVLKQNKGQSPLDRMDEVVLSVNYHAKILSDRLIVEYKRSGQQVPLDLQPKIYETTARAVSQEALAKFGPDHQYGITDDPRRGLILDVIKASLPSH